MAIIIEKRIGYSIERCPSCESLCIEEGGYSLSYMS
jgi:hypothetical protein